MDSFVVDRVRGEKAEAHVRLDNGTVEVWVPGKNSVIPAIHALELLAGQLGPEFLNLELRVRTGQPEARPGENGSVYDISEENPVRETGIYIGKRRPEAGEILKTCFEYLKDSLKEEEKIRKTVSELYPVPRWEDLPGLDGLYPVPKWERDLPGPGLSRVRLYRKNGSDGISINYNGANPENRLFHLGRIKLVGE